MFSMRRLLPILCLAAAPCVATAQGFDPGAELRLQNQQRWTESQLRNLEADLGGLRTDRTLGRIQAERLPDPVLAARQARQDATQAENLNRATQAASTARASRLREASPVYDQRLRELGFATSLPIGPR